MTQQVGDSSRDWALSSKKTMEIYATTNALAARDLRELTWHVSREVGASEGTAFKLNLQSPRTWIKVERDSGVAARKANRDLQIWSEGRDRRSSERETSNLGEEGE